MVWESDACNAALENAGQQIIAVYGTGDWFPKDECRPGENGPCWSQLQLTAADFRDCGQNFFLAAQLRPRDPSLEARALFCHGYSLMLNPAKDLDAAAGDFGRAIQLEPR